MGWKISKKKLMNIWRFQKLLLTLQKHCNIKLMEQTKSTSNVRQMTTAEIQSRVATAKSQVLAGELISSAEAHRIIKCHILGLD